ncbi:DUF2489 domain-containing protein [Vibrio ulleungensis]|jgi:ABC-type antimicrobial peptide transport system permease subunit|uniref:DUF2489 domain-containing protein n=1 Tax=Vibrio ulleungensis TaxID=2807619 RepID=A0ABS2HN49_9VIBR|nr:DUF2489 domain-containing protein [Vibrio ulleungensis]MBM7037628.1 DUF2489 domain-containing protein [Vibrio ulleungensis]
MNWTLLIIVGIGIVVALATYAGYLLLQLKKQKALIAQQHKLAVEQRNAKIFESAHTLCLAGIQGQCDLSEISIRLCNVLDYVQGEQRVDVKQSLPATYELFDIVNDMARGESRQELPKKQRMQQTLTRHKAEARLNDAIIEELKVLIKQLQPLNNQISIQTVH